jgi:Flp pilus assembly pilin Flp
MVGDPACRQYRGFAGNYKTNFTIREPEMKDHGLRLYGKILALLLHEEGQDLVEYAMVFAVMALGSAVVMQSMDEAIVQVFTTVGGVFATALGFGTPSAS